MAKDLMDKLISLCKRRGIIFQSSEIYDGISSCYDYGPLGVELKRNLKDIWWRHMTQYRDDVEGIDASILMHPKIWEASGHVESFTDPLVECKTCHRRFKEDELEDYTLGWVESLKQLALAFNKLPDDGVLKGTLGKKLLQAIAENAGITDDEAVSKEAVEQFFSPDENLELFDRAATETLLGANRQELFIAANAAELTQCPVCGSKGSFTEPRMFHLMFQTYMGPIQNDENITFLRPETAQGIYVNFLNVLTPSRQKIPFGIAQIGKAFRNEITPGNFIFRTREFEQMEMQYFVKPDEADKWFEYWKKERMKWYHSLGINPEKLKFHVHRADELAHYAKAAVDVIYEFPFGWNELEGIHNRTDFDLTRHSEHSNKTLDYYDQEAEERYIPYIIETSGGIDRTLLALLTDAYEEDDERTVLKLHPKLAPVKVGVFPLVKRDNMPELARQVANSLKCRFKIFYDEGGSIGRRYRRQDEAGTPYGVTIDSQTLEDNTVTIRERDTMDQVRVHIDKAGARIGELIRGYQKDAGLK